MYINGNLEGELTCHSFDFSKFIDFDDEYDPSLEEENQSVQSDDSYVESIGNTIGVEVFDHYMAYKAYNLSARKFLGG